MPKYEALRRNCRKSDISLERGKYREWLEKTAKTEGKREDLVFVCNGCHLKMPYIPRVNGKKQCPCCGDPLFIVGTIFVSTEEATKLAEELEALLEKSRSSVDGLGQPCQVGRKTT